MIGPWRKLFGTQHRSMRPSTKMAMNECAMNESLSVSPQLMQLSKLLHLPYQSVQCA